MRPLLCVCAGLVAALGGLFGWVRVPLTDPTLLPRAQALSSVPSGASLDAAALADFLGSPDPPSRAELHCDPRRFGPVRAMVEQAMRHQGFDPEELEQLGWATAALAWHYDEGRRPVEAAQAAWLGVRLGREVCHDHLAAGCAIVTLNCRVLLEMLDRGEAVPDCALTLPVNDLLVELQRDMLGSLALLDSLNVLHRERERRLVLNAYADWLEGAASLRLAADPVLGPYDEPAAGALTHRWLIKAFKMTGLHLAAVHTMARLRRSRPYPEHLPGPFDYARRGDDFTLSCDVSALVRLDVQEPRWNVHPLDD